jgi:ATP-binding cassette subfamily F protein uup
MEVKLSMKSSYIGSKIFDAKGVWKSFPSHTPGAPDKVILRDYNYTFARYEKMGIIGNNGTGKSTFLKMLLGQVKPDRGHFDIGETVRFGYYSQDGLQFDEDKKVIDIVRDIADVVLMSDGSKLTATQFLQNFLFTPEKQFSYVRKLSGGERRRLYLCTVLMRSPNFLILDEPTNDLDIVTLNVLEEYLQDFGGCVIVVSHDRYFMDKVVDHLLVFHGEGELQDYPGNYSDYREWRELKAAEQREAAAAAATTSSRTSNVKAAAGAPAAAVKPKTEKPLKMTFNERREFEALEKQLPELEAEKKALEESMSSGTLTSQELMEQGQRMMALIAELEEKEMRWLELSEKA